MSDHYTTVRATRGGKRTLFYSSCDCGWVGPTRSTNGSATADARFHDALAKRERKT